MLFNSSIKVASKCVRSFKNTFNHAVMNNHKLHRVLFGISVTPRSKFRVHEDILLHILRFACVTIISRAFLNSPLLNNSTTRIIHSLAGS